MIAASLLAGGVALAVGPEASGVSGAAGDPDFSLTVSPARLVVPPEEIDEHQSFHVINGGRLPVDIVVDRTNFTMDGSGKMLFEHDAPHSAVAWLKARPARFHLAPGGERSVSVLIDPPPEPEHGEHQVALLFVTPAGAGGGNISLNRAIGTPIYITVPGPIDTSVRIDGFRASVAFPTGGPVDFTATVENRGTVHRDFFGPRALKVDVNGYEVPFPDFTVLRGEGRDVVVRWADPPFMCVCHATVSVSGIGGTSRQSITFLILPLHLFGALIAVALALYAIAWLLYRRRRAQVPGADQAPRERADRDRDDLDRADSDV
ncbi:hypothetical protein OG884_21180 [Streptosporangium sp. NBC_01755]|uniref:hypothetical protein n=1 Tax=unclassified Streptosporangium TaxID=2632669 RepID=UPI002DD8BF16|nr:MULTISPECIES: hypothetical protein [unclassified Streptosporangium]WSA24521.1 hypothetical protein OIE13_26745 [Streptosporangium sp. NBC_01810]WSC97405.1 hypothetical protein OG884_21180 [Streptosporangium sp. NBC_01755]